jgi:hypothetical protein
MDVVDVIEKKAKVGSELESIFIALFVLNML